VSTSDHEPGSDELITSAPTFAATHPIPEGELRNVAHVHRSDRSSTAIASIEPGGGLRPHFHTEHDEVIVFLEGEADFRLGEEVTTVRAGDVVSVPAGVVHATIRARTHVLLAASFAPGFDLANEDRTYVDAPPVADLRTPETE
jgi:quercetin dioxygenase-like cupin family protein